MPATLDALKGGDIALHPAREAVASMTAVALSAEQVQRVAHGMPVAADAQVDSARAALIDDAGVLVAVAEREGGDWRARVVLRDA